MTTVRLPLILASALIAAPAFAQAAPSTQVTAGLTAGTLGIGPELGVRGRMIGVRGNATLLSVSHGINSNDIDYDGKVRLRSGGVMLDVFPGGGGFRLSAGARLNRNRARVVATPTQPTQVGGLTFTPAQIGTLTGRGTVRDIAPAVTIGYAGRLRPGFVLGIEAGALFQGRVRVGRFVSSTGLIPADRLEAERRDIQDDVDDYKVYPILQLTGGWRF